MIMAWQGRKSGSRAKKRSTTTCEELFIQELRTYLISSELSYKWDDDAMVVVGGYREDGTFDTFTRDSN